MSDLYVGYCPDHNAENRVRKSCHHCLQEILQEHDNGYLEGWTDAKTEMFRVHLACGIFWWLKVGLWTTTSGTS